MWVRATAGAVLAVFAAVGGAACGDDGDDGDGDSTSAEVRTVDIEADEYTFSGDPNEMIVAGETIQFVVTNVGELTHEMQVLTDAGRVLGRTAEIPPGGRDDVIVEFSEAGVYTVLCDIDDHQSRGQRASINVGDG